MAEQCAGRDPIPRLAPADAFPPHVAGPRTRRPRRLPRVPCPFPVAPARRSASCRRRSAAGWLLGLGPLAAAVLGPFARVPLAFSTTTTKVRVGGVPALSEADFYRTSILSLAKHLLPGRPGSPGPCADRSSSQAGLPPVQHGRRHRARLAPPGRTAPLAPVAARLCRRRTPGRCPRLAPAGARPRRAGCRPPRSRRPTAETNTFTTDDVIVAVAPRLRGLRPRCPQGSRRGGPHPRRGRRPPAARPRRGLPRHRLHRDRARTSL